MKTIILTLIADFFKISIIVLALMYALSLTGCAVSRGDWKPEKVKMQKVEYNGHQVTRGYIGY